MPGDVLDVDDRIVHEQAEREDQREQGHAVDRVAEEQIDPQGQAEDDRHGHGHDEGLAPAQAQGQESDDDQDGDPERLDQFVHLVIGGQTGVPRDDHVDVVGHHLSPQVLGGLEYRPRDGDGVGPLLLGDGDGHGRVLTRPRR